LAHFLSKYRPDCSANYDCRLEALLFDDNANICFRWKSPDSIFRTKWDLKAIPTLVKYTRTEDGVSQKQLVEKDVKDEGLLKALAQS
jgi:hypothetical protein